MKEEETEIKKKKELQIEEKKIEKKRWMVKKDGNVGSSWVNHMIFDPEWIKPNRYPYPELKTKHLRCLISQQLMPL